MKPKYYLSTPCYDCCRQIFTIVDGAWRGTYECTTCHKYIHTNENRVEIAIEFIVGETYRLVCGTPKLSTILNEPARYVGVVQDNHTTCHKFELLNPIKTIKAFAFDSNTLEYGNIIVTRVDNNDLVIHTNNNGHEYCQACHQPTKFVQSLGIQGYNLCQNRSCSMFDN